MILSLQVVINTTGNSLEKIWQLEKQLDLEMLEKQVEMEKIRQSTERMKMENGEQSKLQLIREGKFSPGGCVTGDSASVGSAPGGIDVVVNLHLVPKFNERDPDTFFTLFQRTADAKKLARFGQSSHASVRPHWESSGGIFGYMC